MLIVLSHCCHVSAAMTFCVLECPPLGMESHKIESDQLSASSMSQYRFAPQRARLNMQDSMRGGAWCANSEDTVHWFEIDARKETERMSGAQKSHKSPSFLPTTYPPPPPPPPLHLYLQLFFANSDKESPVMNRLAVPVVARYIRVIPQSWNGSLCMRLEVLGCPLSGEPHTPKHTFKKNTRMWFNVEALNGFNFTSKVHNFFFFKLIMFIF
uniref:F5/8 type C domain-containing protein n=1 Tax=Oryzias latipes TaxID=8090 RepID=A0A3B3HNQ1_ORYLA